MARLILLFALFAVTAFSHPLHVPPKVRADVSQDIDTISQRRLSTIVGSTDGASSIASWYALRIWQVTSCSRYEGYLPLVLTGNGLTMRLITPQAATHSSPIGPPRITGPAFVRLSISSVHMHCLFWLIIAYHFIERESIGQSIMPVKYCYVTSLKSLETIGSMS